MKPTYHSNGHQIIATHGPVVVSVAVPVTGQFTDAREWLRRFRIALSELNEKLEEACEH